MKTLHSIQEVSTNEFIVEMMARGLDVSSIIEQLQEERKKVAVAGGGKVIEFPQR